MIWGPFQMAKDKKQSRPKAETPKGFRDYFDQEVSERNEMLQQVARVTTITALMHWKHQQLKTLTRWGSFYQMSIAQMTEYLRGKKMTIRGSRYVMT